MAATAIKSCEANNNNNQSNELVQRDTIESYNAEAIADTMGDQQTNDLFNTAIDEFFVCFGNSFDQYQPTEPKCETIVGDNNSQLASGIVIDGQSSSNESSPVKCLQTIQKGTSSASPINTPNDHDYIRTESKRDLNNNALDLFDQILSRPANYPLSPLSNHSLDIGYESMSSPTGSETSSKTATSSNLFDTSNPIDDYLLDFGGILDNSFTDSLIDPSLLELFPNMF